MQPALYAREPRRGARGLAIAIAVGLLLPVGAVAQDGTIVGTVTDGASGRVLGSASVSVDGTGIGTLTNSRGQFVLVPVPPGEHSVTVNLVGYRSESLTVTVTAGGTHTLDFNVQVTAVQMEELVVTGTGVATERKRLGNSVATVNVDALENKPITSFSDVLQGRSAGVVGLPGGGDTGSGGRIRIRGGASLSQTNEPIIYVDGIRIDRGSGGSWGAGQAQTRRIDDIDPNSIERIEILKGASAATLYGTEASNGVIQIFTKKGQQGAPRWNIQTDQTAIRAPYNRFIPLADYPRNADDVARMQQRWGVNLQPYQVYEHRVLDEMFTTGYAQVYSMDVSGGGDLITYFASGRYHNENGPFGRGPEEVIKEEDTIVRRQGTLGVNVFPFDDLRIRLTGLYSESTQTSLAGGNNIFGVFSSALMGQLRLASPTNLYGQRAFATLRENAQRQVGEDVEHFAGSLNANWTVMDGLVVDATFGVDVTNGRNVSFFPFGWNVDGFSGYYTDGNRGIGDRNHREVTADFKASHSMNFTDAISSQLTVGGQGFLTQNVYSGGSAQEFPGPGLEVVSAGADQSVSESWLRVVNTGVYFQEQVGYEDWLFLTVGARFDANSAFGEEFETATYPKAGLSFVPTDLMDWDGGLLSSIRLRGSYGRSGQQPGAFDKFTTFTPLPSAAGPGLQPGNLGNQALQPEVTDEYDVGVEMGLFDDRLSLDVAYWDKSTTNALVARQFPFTGGFTARQLDNIGQLDAMGVEVTLSGQVYSSSLLSLNVFANTAYLDQVVTSLGGAPPLKTGNTYPRYRNFLKEGYHPGAFFGAVLDPNMAIPLNLSDDAGLGLGACQEPSRAQALEYFSVPRNPSGSFEVIPIGCAGGSTEYLDTYMGKPNPDFAGSFGFDMQFLGNFELATNFEYKLGDVYTQDLTGGFRQSNAVIGRNTPLAAQVGSILENPASSAEERLDAALTWARELRSLAPMSGMNNIWRSDMIRFREVNLSYRMPTDMIEPLGLSNATLSVGGRNVWMWVHDDYRGIDPEINPNSACVGGGHNCNFLTGSEAFGVPIPRRFTFSARVGF